MVIRPSTAEIPVRFAAKVAFDSENEGVIADDSSVTPRACRGSHLSRRSRQSY
jgi:hypothetical protein